MQVVWAGREQTFILAQRGHFFLCSFCANFEKFQSNGASWQSLKQEFIVLFERFSRSSIWLEIFENWVVLFHSSENLRTYTIFLKCYPFIYLENVLFKYHFRSRCNTFILKLYVQKYIQGERCSSIFVMILHSM